MPIHPTAEIHPTARIHDSAEIGPNVLVRENTIIGEGCVLMRGCVVGPNTRLGVGNTVHYYAIIGHDAQHLAFDPKLDSGVIVGDHNHFREFSTVHRAIHGGANTIIGDHNFLMASSHVAHDCVIGNHVVLANMAGLAGHVSVGDRAFISGPTGVHQWVRIGRLAMVGGLTGIGKDVPPFMIAQGRTTLTGLNAVGLRRAGVSGETRMALKKAYRLLFRSGRPLNASLADLKSQHDGQDVAEELAELIEFCSVRSKRGYCRGLRSGAGGASSNDLDDANGSDV